MNNPSQSEPCGVGPSDHTGQQASETSGGLSELKQQDARHSLPAVLAALYRNEINCGLQSFWDGGWTVWIGDDDWNGREALAEFDAREDSHIAAWLAEAAAHLYPKAEWPWAAREPTVFSAETDLCRPSDAKIIAALVEALNLARGVCRDASKDTYMTVDDEVFAQIDAAIAKASAQ